MAKFNVGEYFEEINSSLNKAYAVAESARSRGFDPEDKVDIPLAKNMAERVVALVSSSEPKLAETSIPSRIFELEEKYGKLDWRVALTISLEVSQGKFCSFDSKIK